jgi:hypothetical protein
MVTKQSSGRVGSSDDSKDLPVPDILSFDEKVRAGKKVVSILGDIRVLRIGDPPEGDKGPGKGYVGIQLPTSRGDSYLAQELGREITFVTGMAANVQRVDSLEAETADQARFKEILRARLLKPV